MASSSLALLDKLETFTTQWSQIIAQGQDLLAEFLTIHQERQDVVYSCTGSISNNFDLLETTKKNLSPVLLSMSPVMASLVQDAFPRLLVKQTTELSDILDQLQVDILNELDKISNSISWLMKESISKASVISKSARDEWNEPHLINQFEIVDWLDTIHRCYARELGSKHQLYMDISKFVSGNQSSSELRPLVNSWRLAEWLDLPLETLIHERVRLARQFIKKREGK